MSVDDTDVETRIADAWDRISSAYQDRYEISPEHFHYGPMCPDESELGLIGDVTGLRVLDLGCGGGQNTIWLAERGAEQALGLDPSASQIGFARKLAESRKARAQFAIGDSRACRDMPGQFDLAVSIYALMYAADLRAALTDIHLALAQGGRLVLALDHPWRIAGAWKGGQLIVGDYFAEGWDSWDYDFPEQEVSCRLHRVKRPLDAILTDFLAAGFRLDGMLEPRPPARDDMFARRSKHGENSPLNVYSRDKLERVPSTLILWGSKA
ncbi:class I SAM-dependent methyltransferase [Maricaulis sp.]|uniref:class I SAM-dependent methyltransferase n=1 Tax=Maricaulis sp. TaxID=1486257 RepID=UPI002602A62B|nr:class I SAM-dependent methyltransferase [Maricaulis sp.]